MNKINGICPKCEYQICQCDEKQSFGAGEFKIVVSPDKVKMIIHDKITVAETNKDVYKQLFDFCKMIIEVSADGKNKTEVVS